MKTVGKLAASFKSLSYPNHRSKTFGRLLAATLTFFLIVNIYVYWTGFNRVVKYEQYGTPVGTPLTLPSAMNDEFIKKAELMPAANPHRYNFIISSEDKCKGKDVFLVVMVTSSPSHVQERDAIRKTWGNETMFAEGSVKVLFALGRSGSAHLENAVHAESKRHGDIIQEDFRDTYRNMTTKTVMILRWAVTFCSGAQYVMKTDDDMFVNVGTLVTYLRSLEQSSDREFRSGLFMGTIRTGVHPVRSPPTDRLYVSKEDFPPKMYPNYLSGTGYVMAFDAARRLYVTALMTSPIPMEDVYMGICAERAGITPRDHSGFTFLRFGFTVCTHRLIVTSHHYGPEELLAVWAVLQDSPECGWLRTHFSTLYAKLVREVSVVLPCLVWNCGAVKENRKEPV